MTDPRDHLPVDDPFHRLDYRRSIAWPARIEREWPFLEAQLGRASGRNVLDLGCGTGEHSAFLASKGLRVVGIDRSPTQIEAAREHENAAGENGPVFLEGDLRDLPRLTEETFANAVCLGNVLPSLDDEALAATLAALRQRLRSKGQLIAQILNYERILGRDVRHLPINFRPAPDGDGEIVFLRAMLRDEDERYIRFFPTSLMLRPGVDPPVEVKVSRELRMRAWRWPELEAVLVGHGFGNFRLYGDVNANPFVPAESSDLVFVAEATS